MPEIPRWWEHAEDFESHNDGASSSTTFADIPVPNDPMDENTGEMIGGQFDSIMQSEMAHRGMTVV